MSNKLICRQDPFRVVQTDNKFKEANVNLFELVVEKLVGIDSLGAERWEKRRIGDDGDLSFLETLLIMTMLMESGRELKGAR